MQRVLRKLDFENDTRLGFVQDVQPQRGDVAMILVQFVDAGEKLKWGNLMSGSLEYSPVGAQAYICNIVNRLSLIYTLDLRGSSATSPPYIE
jgi:hypothetical protein